MQHKQTYYKDVNNIKRKRNKTYSECNNFQETEQYAHTYSDAEELRPTKYYKPNRQSSYDMIKPRKDDSIIDVYVQRTKKDIYLYDTKHKCFYKGFDTAHTQNYYYNYSGTDVSRLLIFMEYTNNTMQRLLKDFKTSKLQDTPDLSTIMLVIDSKKLKDFFYIDTYRRKQNFLAGDFNYKAGDTTVLFSNITQESFDITIGQHSIDFQISISKYPFTSFLETLIAVCNLSRYSSHTYEFKVLSLYVGNWYFRNLSQGHLLRILLKNLNIVTLNFMRKLYFVIITDTKSNIHIQINFILKNGILSLYEEDSLNSFCGPVKWNNDHNNILQNSTSMDTCNILKILYKKRKTLKSLKAITYTKSASSDLPIRTLQSECEDSLQTDDEDDTINFDVLSSNQNWSNATINLTINKSVGTSFIFCIDEISGQDPDIEKKSASALCNFKFETDINMSFLEYSKFRLTKLLHSFKLVGARFSLPIKHDYINETMFDISPVDFYVTYVNKYWNQMTCRTLYKNFFKCLAHSIIFTLFSYEI